MPKRPCGFPSHKCQTGKRLMARCQMLLQENEELGKTISSGRTAKLEGEIALQKTLVTEMKNNQSELDEFLGDLEEDVEGMQTMIYVLQQQLRESKEQITALEDENTQLRGGVPASKTLKQRDKVKSETSRHSEYESYKTQTDYAPMETGYYQNERTDSDLEAEYNYEGLYENDDKYQEELEAQQKALAEAKQYEYEENGYRGYEDYDSHSQQEAMDTSEVDNSTKINPDYKVTTNTTQPDRVQTSDCIHSTSGNSKQSNGQLQTSNNITDTQHTDVMDKQQSNTSTEISNSPIGNGQHLEDSSTKECRQSDDYKVQTDDDKHRTTAREANRDNNITSNQDQLEQTSDVRDNRTTETREKTPEKQRIPSPRVDKVSPGKTNSNSTIVSSTNEEASKTESSNSVTDNNKGSPRQVSQADVKDNSSPLTDKAGSNNREKSAVREREPVLQQFFNGITSTGITSTVDDIEDL